MRKFLFVVLIAAAVYACTQLQKTTSPPVLHNSFCADSSINSPCAVIPKDVNEVFGVGYNSFLDSVHQPPFDVLSWQTFIALNWPADSTGNPMNGNIGDNPTAPRVWEFYADPVKVFSSGPAELMGIMNTRSGGDKLFHMTSKTSTHPAGKKLRLGEIEEADGNPLIDVNLNFVLYEVKMNPDEVAFVKKHNLTTLAGIDSFWRANNKRFQLPPVNGDQSKGKEVGTIEIKASWRILEPAKGDDSNRYFHRRADIFVAAKNSATGQSFTVKNALVGLVGMHIIHKTPKLNYMVWSTFEHMDNTPDNPQAAQMDQRPNPRWSFYNPICLNCPINTPPQTRPQDSGRYIWQTKPPYAALYSNRAPNQDMIQPDSFGTQVVRVYPIYKWTEELNKLWQEKLRGTVWSNYRLIGSQWALADDPFPKNAPNFLGNTTLETYLQSEASCISCHNGAYVIYKTDTIFTSQSFLFGFAR
jgi:hypothetical protein